MTDEQHENRHKEAAAEQMASRATRWWRSRIFQAYLVVGILAFGILGVLASAYSYFPIDLSIARAVQTVHAQWFTSLMWWVSIAGYAPQSIIISAAIAILLFVIGLRWEAVAAAIAAAGAEALVELVKIIVHRPRPSTDLVDVLQQVSSSSFPSGHVLTYTAFLGFVFFLGYTFLKPSLARTLLLVILGSLVVLIGISRIYLGDHWASDVLGGYLLGSLWLMVSVSVYQWGKTRFFVRQPLTPEKPEGTATAS
jgi:undecaprenyl-diphosphatase